MNNTPYDQHMLDLADKWLKGTIEPQEEKEFAAWYNQFNDQAELSLNTDFAKDELVLKERIARSLSKRITQAERIGAKKAPVRSIGSRPVRWAAAAVIAALLIGGIWLLRNHSSAPSPAAFVLAMNDLPPGGNRAVLTLGNGQQVILDTASNGALAIQGGTEIIKLDSGKLAYQGEKAGVAAVQYNTLSTPRGGQFQLVLPDGTRVWLNAASSIHYPTRFTGKQRLVDVTGEAYFEVTKNPSQPFMVSTSSEGQAGAGVTIEVLGTSFNINTYPEEPEIKTTLLEGSVRVLHKGADVLLRPGQQGSVSNKSEQNIRINTVDVQDVIAWKNGLFQFSQSDWRALMRQLERWYDVKVSYEGSLPQKKFDGEIQRDLPLRDVLEALGKYNIHFKVEGRMITVLP